MSKVTTTFEAVDTSLSSTIQKIEVEMKAMNNTTEKLEKKVNFSFSAMAKAGAGLAVGIGLIKGAFSVITGAIDDFGQALDLGGRLNDLSARTGETAGNLLLLERAFQNSGVGADAVGCRHNVTALHGSPCTAIEQPRQAPSSMSAQLVKCRDAFAAVEHVRRCLKQKAGSRDQ